MLLFAINNSSDGAASVYSIWDAGIVFYNSSGLQLGFLPFLSPSYLDINPEDGSIMALSEPGQIYRMDPNTGQLLPWLDLRKLFVDTNSIYDIAQGRYWNFDGMIIPANSNFGDFDIGPIRNNVMDLFVTGLSQANTFSFVMRVRIDTSTRSIISAKVVAASSASTAGTNNLTRGIAVNSQRIVATTLPYQAYPGPYDRAVAFSADFPETNMGLPAIKLGGADMWSSGMSTDPSGNFYIATGRLGTSLAGIGSSGALVVLSSDCNQIINIYSQTSQVFDA